jgi:hypothetical protein
MSDQELRELERRYRQSGDATDEAAWLGARLRVGDVDRSRVELCAWLDHAPARVALGDEAPGPLVLVARERLDEQLLPLERYGRDAVIGGFVAIAGEFLARRPYDVAVPEQRKLVVELMRMLEVEANPVRRREGATGFLTAMDAILTPLLPTQPFLRRPVSGFRRIASAVLIDSSRGAANTLWPALNDFSPEPEGVVALLRGALVPWALGY